MYYRLFILGLVFSFSACAPPVEELSLGQRSDPIRNGTRAPQTLELTEGQQLAVGWLHSRGRAWQNFCTGTLVAPRLVMTARHCVDGQRQDSIAFGIGLMPNQPFAVLDVLSAHSHPQRDAALLVLTEDAVERHPELEPIPFNRSALSQDLIGRQIEAAGYGETYDRSRSGRYFAAVALSQVTPTEVIVDGRGEQGICFGDSGGPVIMEIEEGQPAVLGVESWGDPSCVGIDHLTRLDVLADWIDEVSAEALRPPDPECEMVPTGGRCDGEVLFRCRSGRYEERDCADEGLQCRRPDRDTGFICAEIDVCAEVGSLGVCDGETVVRCRFGDLVTDDCGMRDLTCQTDTSGAFCGAPAEPVEEEDAPDEESVPSDMGLSESGVDGGEPTPEEAPDGDGVSETAEADSAVSGGGCSTQGADGGSSLTCALAGMLILGLSRRRRRRIAVGLPNYPR